MTDFIYRDPHLYPGVAVDVLEQFWPEGAARTTKARFVREFRHGESAWIVTYSQFRPSKHWRVNSVIVRVEGLRVSNTPSEPPPLPDWAA